MSTIDHPAPDFTPDAASHRMAGKILRRRPGARQRGAFLVEAALAVGIAASLLALTVSVTAEQQRRSDAVTIAGEKRLIMDAARGFIQNNSADLIRDMFQFARTSGGEGRRVVTIADLTAGGYLSPAFTPGGTLNRLFGQNYVLLMRPVFRGDTANPAVSLRQADMDPLGTNQINPAFMDGNPDNGEIGIEAVLFSTGGTPIPSGQAARVVDATERINAGFVLTGNRARGSGGTMNFIISGFSGFPQFAQAGAGRFASPISLGAFGPIGDTVTTASTDLRRTFFRCVGINPAHPVMNACLNSANNVIYSDIALRPFDSDNNGSIDRFPAITGATRLICRDEAANHATAPAPNTFLIDCQTTRINGVLDVTGSAIRFRNQPVIEDRSINGVAQTVVTADRMVLSLPSGNRDLSQTPSLSRLVAARDRIPVHQCPATDITGSPLFPRAMASVAALVDPWGRPVAGTFARAERGNMVSGTWTPSPTGAEWMARIIYTVSEDFCQSTLADPMNVRSTFTDLNNPNSAPNFVPGTRQPNTTRCATSGSPPPPRPDGLPDVYEMFPMGSSSFGAAILTLTCGP